MHDSDENKRTNFQLLTLTPSSFDYSATLYNARFLFFWSIHGNIQGYLPRKKLHFCYYREKTLWRKHFFFTDFFYFYQQFGGFFFYILLFPLTMREKIFFPYLALANIFLHECI